MIRVLIVDDHAVVREGLRTFLELQDGLEVIGEAADGRQAVDEAERLAPDVILMDLVMPKLDGVAAMRELRARESSARVIVLTSFLDDERLMPAIQAGAAGYLLKDVEPGDPRRPRRRRDPRPDRRRARRAGDRRLLDVRGARSGAPHTPRVRGPRPDRARAVEQADRARARDRREDGQDPRRPRIREARRHRPHPGRAARRSARAG
jgi:CheY-like chemotaxis protein